MEFDWDDKKARTNVAKHGVTFHEAASVFGDLLAMTFQDPDHSTSEDRFLTFGLSISGRLLAVIHSAPWGVHSNYQCSLGYAPGTENL